MRHQTPLITIFAGGESRRMGSDKTQLLISEMTMLEHMAIHALKIAPQIVVVGRMRPSGWTIPQVEFLPDDAPGLGPLGALQTALRRAETVVALACDLPLLTSESINWLIEQGTTPMKPHGTIVDNNGQWEPLFSIYTHACLPLIEENLSNERRSLHALIKAGQFAFVEAPLEIGALLVNVNTPEDWAALKSDSALINL